MLNPTQIHLRHLDRIAVLDYKSSKRTYWLLAILMLLFQTLLLLFHATVPAKEFTGVIPLLGIFISIFWAVTLLHAEKQVRRCSRAARKTYRQYLQAIYSDSQLSITLLNLTPKRRLSKLKSYTWLICGLIFLFFVLWVFQLATSKSSYAPEPRYNGSLDRYFEKLRKNESSLVAFFSQMPKGGDLHHHLIGSVYTEYFWNNAVSTASSLFIKDNYPVVDNVLPPGYAGKRLDTIKDAGEYRAFKQQVLQEWSIKDFTPGYRAPDRHFFESFEKFGKFKGVNFLGDALTEIKSRAKREGVQYIETMINKIKFVPQSEVSKNLKTIIPDSISSLNEEAVFENFAKAYFILIDNGLADTVDQYIQNTLFPTHEAFVPDSDSFLIRYIAVADRTESPLSVFINLLTAFEAANHPSKLIVGVNILNREDDRIAIRDYTIHMKMIRFLKQHYPHVKVSLHAGELTRGTVQSEILGQHIRSAVELAGADRIGHGVDLAYDQNIGSLLAYMNDSAIAIEINLWSNEFILGVKNERHPILLYLNAGVPVVISTDDAGILRSDLRHQFVLLASRYPQVRYKDIRSMILNSIKYSFLPDDIKTSRLKNLEQQIEDFEQKILSVGL